MAGNTRCLVEGVAGSEQHGFDERVFLQGSGYSTFERKQEGYLCLAGCGKSDSLLSIASLGLTEQAFICEAVISAAITKTRPNIPLSQ